jgi:excisionase family DNA binding protein
MSLENVKPEPMYRTSEAARYLGISRYAVMDLCKAGALGFYWIGRRRVFSESQLKTFLAGCEVKAHVKNAAA